MAIAALSSPAFAKNTGEDDAFKVFMDKVTGWTQGPLGIGLATTMLLIGGAIGVAMNTPVPALSGVGSSPPRTGSRGLINVEDEWPLCWPSSLS